MSRAIVSLRVSMPMDDRLYQPAVAEALKQHAKDLLDDGSMPPDGTRTYGDVTVDWVFYGK